MVDTELASSDGVPSPQAPRRGAVAFIFVTILLDMLALGLIMPILPKLIEGFVANDTAQAARIFGLFGTAWALMQFVFSPVLGSLSDRFGRRPVILLSNFGLAADYVLMAMAPSLAWLFIGRLISGITSASISTAFAYIADLTPPERRAAIFGRMGAAFGAGFVLGPATGGLLGDIDPRLPFWAAAGLSFVNAVYGLLVLPESLGHERRSPFRWRTANPLGALQLLRSDRMLAGLSMVNFITQLAHVVLPSTFVLYATYRYGWDTRTVGLTLAVVGVCAMVVQGGAVGWIVRSLGERGALLLGLCSGTLGFLIFGLAPTGMLSWLGIPAMALWGVSGAAIQALMTRLVPADRQGQLQGATSSVQSMAQLAGPFLFTLTFAYFIGATAPVHLPGAPFLLASMLLVVALAIALRTIRAATAASSS
ncbi:MULTISPECIES: TCR/Tet family MFS transporter [Bradyrhizobium]|jgi:DHA1 family tetracycline resistance protein-like MFS transporter|uniref:TCR/Tet family MFS transporter n=2 Tax=Bradyrhizobium TaxID=374 RepID=A0ABS5GIQ6_9BRAD|nr:MULTISPECIES: TCR/Tet family MFS transporter [Bradyrhizobium]MBR1141228.1 TCR/Tet family MFS transporter [Bradyrhizobium denitrificans]MDU1497502.1 TCR/Tet family MFS transporter [Bradyrhizobium sp.]MDU1547762.1 TCR/Tet family MFS transporter [Bradyrhizobium sp.]MDU1689066.1 TCR/Tet family MFS transporter [Bradyrhizobium sp.]MDU1804039.1 TCR/Tet family MFS transporter [Bradyrhizobium sp.]